MQMSCVWWRDIPSPSMKKPVLCHVHIHFSILLFIINSCFFDFSFELVQTSAWFPHYDLNKIFNMCSFYICMRVTVLPFKKLSFKEKL